jgi:hypothetical protein
MLTQAYSRARRWRVCLDECQMVREATTNLAKACRDLVSTHRWMISGTPLTTKIDDLNGELQFLRVWPFSLQVRRATRARQLRGAARSAVALPETRVQTIGRSKTFYELH